MKVTYFVPKSESTARQIQAWARGGDYENESRDLGRHSGQLSDNITEQRVLQTRLLDLARERFRTITEREYQKNRFIDRQQKKTRMMKDLLKNINLEQYRHKSCNTVDILREKSYRMRLMILARRQGIDLDKLDEEDDLEELMAQLSSRKHTEIEPLENVNEDDEERLLEAAGQRQSSVYSSYPQHPKSALPTINRNPPRSRISVSRDSRKRSVFGRRDVRTADALSSTRLEAINDPRCSRLLQTLTPRYSPQTPLLTVSTIVCQIDTLTAPTRYRMELLDKRRKMETLRLPSTLNLDK